MTTDVIHTRAYRRFRAEMKALFEAADAPCWMDGQPIDYGGARNEPESFELDHALPRKTHAELALDPGNARASHSRCNRSRQASDPRPGIGLTSEEW